MHGWVILAAAVIFCCWCMGCLRAEDQTVAPSPVDVAFLVHTCDGYRRYWQGFSYYFFHFHPEPQWPVYFANETLPPPDADRMIHIPTGPGEWSDRLMRALSQIETEYVLYLQEDIWLTAPLTQTFLDRAIRQMEERELSYLKLQDDCRFVIDMPENWQNRRFYVISHHPGLWKKDFLLSTLQPGMSPFRHESGVNRALHGPRRADAFRCGCIQDLQPTAASFPYLDVSRQGQLRPEGRAMLDRAGLTFDIAPDEIMSRRAG